MSKPDGFRRAFLFERDEPTLLVEDRGLGVSQTD